MNFIRRLLAFLSAALDDLARDDRPSIRPADSDQVDDAMAKLGRELAREIDRQEGRHG